MQATDSRFSSDHQIKIGCNELLLGMFVCELDCAWSVTPFPLGGFHLKRSEDIEILQKFCKTVSIDTNRGALPAKYKNDQLTILSSARKAAPAAAEIKVNRDTYPVTHSVKKQIDSAFKFYSLLQTDFLRLTQAIREGHSINFADLEKPVAGLIDAVIANPQTLVWILNTDPTEQHQGSYCVRAAIWATILARQIGMKRSEIDALFLGTLLADIGMHLLPEKLVNKRGHFRKKEFLAYRKHIEFGLELLSQHPELDDKISRIVRNHHERHDGLGFPGKLRGNQIPTLARFASFAYCFERLLKTTSPGKEVSPAKAMSRLYKQRVLKFPEQLIVEFIHILGMYPAGTVVELASGELALILEQNPVEKLFPKIAIVTDKQKNRLEKPVVMELPSKESSSENRTIVGSPTLNRSLIDSRDYTFSFCGMRLSVGSLGFRL